MPIYEFKCAKCGEKLTKLCRMGETGEDLQCSKCGEKGLKRMISGFASPGVSGGNGGGSCTPGCGSCCSSCH